MYTTGHLEILRSDYEKGFDVSPFIDPRLTTRQLNMILDGLDLLPYITTDMSPYEIDSVGHFMNLSRCMQLAERENTR